MGTTSGRYRGPAKALLVALLLTLITPRTGSPPPVGADPADTPYTVFLPVGSKGRDVTAGGSDALDPTRSVLVHGFVQARDGGPLGDVTVSVQGKPEFGSTRSASDGTFELTVNGGGPLVFAYAKPGFLPVQRRISPQWLDEILLPDVALVPLDSQMTTVAFGTNSPASVAKGSMMSDEDGSRQATLLFPPGTSAEMVMPDGSKKPMSSLNIRATEYTVGPNGPLAMPAELPPLSAYTYAIELTADEALADSADGVTFSQPILNYVDNFLNFPVGTAVPTGYYDRKQMAWVPSANGKVIKILGATGGLADVDSDGDGLADTKLNMGTSERQNLVTLYPAGKTLWRVAIPHFSPWDHNWPQRCSYLDPVTKKPVCKPPQLKPYPDPEWDDPCEEDGSIIGCQTQSLGQEIDIAGTPYSLRYSSNRTRGFLGENKLTIPVITGTVPPDLKRIELLVTIAGRRITETFPALPNQSYSFTWDGKDAKGRVSSGRRSVTVSTAYVYDAVYAQGDQTVAFGSPGTEGVAEARFEIKKFSYWYGTLGGPIPPDAGLGGWSLSAHHAYLPSSRVLLKGDGSIQNGGLAVSAVGVIDTLAGRDGLPFTNPIGDGGPAENAYLEGPFAVVVAPDGTIFISEISGFRIRRVGRDGIITTFAGTGERGFSGDGGPATTARFSDPGGMALAPDGSLYVADVNNGRVRKIAPNGIVSTIAGGGLNNNSNVPALDAQMTPSHVALGPDGLLYIADFRGRILRLDLDGMIRVVAGTRTPSDPNDIGDGGPATKAILRGPEAITFGPDGSLFVAEKDGHRVRRVVPDGVIETYVGTGATTYNGDGLPANLTNLNQPIGIAFGPDGLLYIGDSGNSQIRKVDGDLVVAVAGSRTSITKNDDGPATNAIVRNPHGIAFAGDGTMYIAENLRHNVRRVSSVQPSGLSLSDRLIPSTDGREIYVFSSQNRHLRTLDARTAGALFSFAYDSAGRLQNVTDSGGNVTTVERDGNGSPTAIIAPFGQRTTLTLDPNGYLATINNPAGEITRLEMASNGLMTKFTDPRGGFHTYSYDSDGRLIAAVDAAGGRIQLSRLPINSGYYIEATADYSRSTSYQVNRGYNGDILEYVTIPGAFQTTYAQQVDGAVRYVATDGERGIRTISPDPRWRMAAPIDASTAFTRPSGIVMRAAQSRSAQTGGAIDPLSVVTLNSSYEINPGATGRRYSTGYVGATRTITESTPERRLITTTIDSAGRVLTQERSGLALATFAYDPRGRPVSVTRGSGPSARTTSVSYSAAGFVQSATDAANRTWSFNYDVVGRMTGVTAPDGGITGFGYDANGNVTSVTPPGKPAHFLGYTPVDLQNSYVPPAGGPTSYSYNLNQQLTKIARPDGQDVDLGYDYTGDILSTGVLKAVTTTRGTVTYGYGQLNGQVMTATAPGGIVLTYGIDGQTMTSTTWSGPIAGAVTRTVSADDFITARGVNGQVTTFTYDKDGLVTKAGNLTLGRDARNGLLLNTTLGLVTSTLAYNSFGEVSRYALAYNKSPSYTVSFTRDNLGRITTMVESVRLVTDTYSYQYDPVGRLAEVKKNGATTELYTYDQNGNRLTAGPSGAIAATYDSADRIQQQGAATFVHNAAGMLQSKTDGSGTTTYSYDPFGNLYAATLPGGTSIEYLIDAQNRRVGKKVNGSLVQGFLYQDSLRPIAELDGSGAVVSLFVYAGDRNLPDYLVKGGATFQIVSDHLGSPRLVINTATGAVAQRLDYDSYGNVLADSAPGFQPFGFAGGIYDRDLTFVRFGARDYDPATGRFTTPDPKRFVKGQTNLYRYAGNDPVNAIDPTGLFTLGFSGYDVVGGGGKVTITRDGISVCAEIGLGVGVGIELDPFSKNLERNGIYVEGELTAKAGGGAAATVGFRIDPCIGAELKNPKACLGIACLEFSRNGIENVTATIDPTQKDSGFVDFGAGFEGKVAVGACSTYRW